MNCPYSDEKLEYWDGVSNPMGVACNTCQDFDCEHNSNIDENPDYLDIDTNYHRPTMKDILGYQPSDKIVDLFCESLRKIRDSDKQVKK